ncbi:MAG: hypothetical protein ACR2MY_10100 [Candidatus Dormibacteria bacterium]
MSYLLNRLNLGPETQLTAHCTTDNWDFRPLYTDGRCPICNWQPEGWPLPAPPWALALERMQWDFVGLFGLLAVLVVLGYLMAVGTGILHR